jgi:hypothetical protein
MNMHDGSVAWFEHLGRQDVLVVGGKSASLGEITRALGSHGRRCIARPLLDAKNPVPAFTSICHRRGTTRKVA